MTVTDASMVVPPKILPETYFAAGRLYESQGSLHKAITQYRKAVAANHRYVDAYHRLALLQSRTGRHEQAQETFAQAVHVAPNNPVLRNNYGYELLLTKHWTQAVQEFERVIQLKPDFKRAHINLGIVQSRIGMYEESLSSFRKVLAEPDAYYNLGLMHRAQGRLHLAAGCFSHVLTLNSAFTAAKTQLDELAPVLKLSEKPATDPVIEEAFAGSCDAPDYNDNVFVSINDDPFVAVTWSPAELLSYADTTPQTFGFEKTMCDAVEEANGIAIFARSQDIMSTPDGLDHSGAWDFVSTGNFSMSFLEDKFQLTDFLAIMDNEFRCHDKMDEIPWNQEVVTELRTPRPALSATVIEGPPAPDDRKVPPVTIPGPGKLRINITPQHQNAPKAPSTSGVKYPQGKTRKKQNRKTITTPRASLDPHKKMHRVSRPITKTRQTNRQWAAPATTNRSVAIYGSAETRKLNKIAHGPTWAVHTMTAAGSLVLDDPDETTRFIYGSSTVPKGLTVNRQLRPVLAARVVDSPPKRSATPKRRAHPTAAALATIRALNDRLEIVQNEILCLDDESSFSAFQR